MLSLLHHPNLVNLIGYCADGDQRLLVYEYMALGSLEDHLHGICSFNSNYFLYLKILNPSIEPTTSALFLVHSPTVYHFRRNDLCFPPKRLAW